MTIDRAYDRWAATYDSDSNRTRDLDAEVTRASMEAGELARLVPHGGATRLTRVIEAGCGTGKNTGVFAAFADELIAMDFSAEMLGVARAKHVQPNIRFIAHDLTHAWPSVAARADLVSFHLVLEHIEDLGAVFAHAAQACTAGGVVAMTELHPVRQYGGGQAHFTDRDGETVHVTAFVHHLSDYVGAAERAGLRLESLREWWHADDAGKPPRLLSLRFRRD